MVAYVSSLVKNAYQLKMELRGDLEDSLSKLEDAAGKRTRTIKRELLDEIAKMRVSLERDTIRRLTELNESVLKQKADVEETMKRDRSKISCTGSRISTVVLADVEHTYRSFQRQSEKEDTRREEVPHV
ncbi:MAG: hypothetical protein FD153_1058 [Rhodospirillaceae bacterium]|nr:MAG: hypothetical protein FD153_1058 [Rhodospirillaceae bacterium]